MSCRCRFRAKGFTLVELVVVMALIALVVLVAPPFLSTDDDSIGLEAAARKVAGDLRLARSEAIARDREIGGALDLGKPRYAIGGEGWQPCRPGSRSPLTPRHRGRSGRTAFAFSPTARPAAAASPFRRTLAPTASRWTGLLARCRSSNSPRIGRLTWQSGRQGRQRPRVGARDAGLHWWRCWSPSPLSACRSP
jgi:prepilin-type N-terminal cleavage/methylation domain-containing protein